MAGQREIRQKRVADRIQMVIADLFLRRIRDPRLTLITVTDVNVDSELEFANVWVCAPKHDEEYRLDVMKALSNAGSFIRREVAARVQLRRTPQLVFHWDFAPDHAARIDELINTWQSSLPASTGSSNDNKA